MKEKILYNVPLLLVAFTFLVIITACEKESEVSSVTATLTSEATNILQGDTAELVIEFNGGNPPYGFRYNNGVESFYDLGIMESPHIIKVTPDSTVTFSAEAAATYYRNVGTATGTATIEVTPVQYVYDQTISGLKSAFMHASNGCKTGSLLEIRTQNAAYDRRGYVEFDASEITTIEEYSKYRFSFWLTKSHAQGVSAGIGAMEVKGYVGEINESWTWNTQPGLDVLIDGYSQTFNPVTVSTQVKFSGDITNIVKAALASPSKKFTLRIMENLNGTGNKGFYYLGSTTYSDAEKRPTIDILLRRPIN